MPDYDKNDRYDPKAYRSDRFNPYPPLASRGAGNFIGYLLIWLLIGGGLMLFFQGHWSVPEWVSPKNAACAAQLVPKIGATGVRRHLDC